MILLYLLSNKFYNKTQGGHMEKETIDKINNYNKRDEKAN